MTLPNRCSALAQGPSDVRRSSAIRTRGLLHTTRLVCVSMCCCSHSPLSSGWYRHLQFIFLWLFLASSKYRKGDEIILVHAYRHIYIYIYFPIDVSSLVFCSGIPVFNIRLSPSLDHCDKGHALCALFAEGAVPVYKATIIPRGRALGMVRMGLYACKPHPSVYPHVYLYWPSICLSSHVNL